MSDIEYLRRDNGLHVLKANANGEYKANCLCHACEKSKNMSPLSICPILAKLWAISSEHRVIVSVPECTSFEVELADHLKWKDIFVNGRQVKTKMLITTYTDILQMTDPLLPFRADYTMTWSTKTDKGIMHHEGNPVKVTHGMIFNVTLTGGA